MPTTCERNAAPVATRANSASTWHSTIEETEILRRLWGGKSCQQATGCDARGHKKRTRPSPNRSLRAKGLDPCLSRRTPGAPYALSLWRDYRALISTRKRNRDSLAGSGGAHGSPLLEAFAAVHRTPLRRLEGNSGFFSALRANGLGLDALKSSGSRDSALHAIRFTGLAPLGLVLEALVGEEHLLARCEYKLRTAFCALQNLIVVFHSLLRGLAGIGQAAVLHKSDGAGIR